MCTELSDNALSTAETSNCRPCHLTFYQIMLVMQVACGYVTTSMGLSWHLLLPTDVTGQTGLRKIETGSHVIVKYNVGFEIWGFLKRNVLYLNDLWRPLIFNKLNKKRITLVLLYWYTIMRGTRWRNWLRHCATSWKVAVSIPDGVIEIFY
jgi:hypothetical protein